MVQMQAPPQGRFAHLLGLIVMLLVFLACEPAHAQSPRGASLLSDRFTLSVGGFFPYIDSDIRLDSDNSNIPGTEIDLEDDLGMDETHPTVFGGLRWRITPRHRIEAAYFRLNRRGLTAAEGEIRFGDLAIPIGARVDSSLDLHLGRITYGYSLINNGETEVGLLAGAHVASLDANLSIVGEVGGESFGALSEHGGLTAPLPHLGLLGAYAFTPTIVSQARVVGFYLKINDYSGWLVQADLTVTWQFAKHFGVGAGVEYFNFSLEADRANFNGDFTFNYIGPTVFAIATF